MKYLLYIFDLDGTIVDSGHSIVEALKQTMAEFDVDESLLMKGKLYIGHTLENIFESLGIVDIEKARKLYRKFYYEYINTEKPYPGIINVIKRLHNRVLLAISTNKGANGAKITLGNHGLLEYFDIIKSVDNGAPKPDKGSFDDILKFYRGQGKILEPADCLMIGDSPTDMEYAYNCGIDSAYVGWGFFKPEHLNHKPKYIIDRPDELYDLNEETVKMEIVSEIDLHTFKPNDVKKVVEEYLEQAVKKKLGTVRIIHGKGKGVQRNIVRSLLSKNTGVLRFYEAPNYEGGMGATIAELNVDK